MKITNLLILSASVSMIALSCSSINPVSNDPVAPTVAQAVSDEVVSDDGLAKTSGSYTIIVPRTRVPTKYQGYTFEVEIAVDATGHNISSCPIFNGKKHLNIKVWRKNSSMKSWEQTNDLHVLVTKCVTAYHDSRRGSKYECVQTNYCGGTITVAQIALTCYVVREFVRTALNNNWPYIVRAATALIP